MTLPFEKMKLSDKELNCMKMCQKAPKCTDFSINPGEACPRPPYPRLAPTELAFMHSVNQNTHINLKLVATTLSIEWNYFRCVKVCQVHNDPHALAWLRVFCARMKIFHVLNIAPPPPPFPTWNPGCAPAVLSLQCQTFGIQIRLVFGLIWVQPVSKDYYFAGFTTGIIPNSWPRILFD